VVNSAYSSHCDYCFQRFVEMVRFQAEKYLEIVRELTEADYLFKTIFKDSPPDELLNQHNKDVFLAVIKDVQKLSEEIKLPTLNEYLIDAHQRISWASSTLTDAMYFNRGMRDVLLANVKSHVFIQVAPDKRDLFFAAINNTAPLYQLYPAVKQKNLEAHLCYAMERYSACVHHLMIAVEVALRKWAKQYKLATSRPLTLEDWEAILIAAQKKLDQIKNSKRSSRNDRKMKHLSETSGHFSFIQKGWRKYSAHGREQFDETSAKTIMNHVEAFMSLLAPKPRKGKPVVTGLFGLGAGLSALPSTGLPKN
jgi:hypothetical protein